MTYVAIALSMVIAWALWLPTYGLLWLVPLAAVFTLTRLNRMFSLTVLSLSASGLAVGLLWAMLA